MRRILPIVTASAAALLAAGCTSSVPTYFVGTDGTTVAVIRWSAPQTGPTTGSITDDTLTGTAPTETMQVQTAAVTVRLRGKDVSFAGNGLYALAGATITGTLSGGTLRITAPGASGYLVSAVLRSATPAVYNSDLAKLRRRASSANTAARRTQARVRPQPAQPAAQVATDQQQVSSDVSTVQTDADTLSSDVNQMSTDVLQTSQDLGQLQSDAANGPGAACENVSTVDDDATTVDDDGTTVGDDETTLTDDIGTVQSDVTQLDSDLATLQKDGGSAVGDPSPQAAISLAQADITNSLSQANSYIATVNGYLKQAYTIATNVSGSNCA